MKKEYKNFPAGGRKIPGRRGSMRKDPPAPPLSRIIREGTIGDCPNCKSTTIKKFFWFRKWPLFYRKTLGCINPKCPNYYEI